MATMETEMKPPVTVVGPIAWLRRNLFSNWYNSLFTLAGIWLIYAMLVPALQWATTEARWAVIEANLPLFMVGLYPREQVWRVWLLVYMLAGLVGLSWGVWKNATRGFAFLALGSGIAFALICLIFGWGEWLNWVIAIAVLLALYPVGRSLSRGSLVAAIAWVLYLPVIFLLVGGARWIPGLVPVEMGKWSGLLLTLLLTIVGIFGSLPLGILLAFGRRSSLPIIRYFSIGYIEIIRGVPLITILYMSDILLPLFLPVDVRPDRVLRAMVGLVMFEAAYQAENVRGGLQSIDRGQYEAAQALGLNNLFTTILIILPQALRAVVPALFNSFISLFKDTSLVAIIGLFDVLKIARSVLAQTEWIGTHRETFLFAFIIYWGLNLAFSYGGHRVEEALGVGKR